MNQVARAGVPDFQECNGNVKLLTLIVLGTLYTKVGSLILRNILLFYAIVHAVMAFCDLNIVRSSKERDKQAIVLRLIECKYIIRSIFWILM